jgi:hypothetical protein
LTRWQRRARLLVGVSAVAFAVFVGLEFRRGRTAAPPPTSVAATDPRAIVETTGGHVTRFNLSN